MKPTSTLVCSLCGLMPHACPHGNDVNGRSWVDMAMTQVSDESLRAECERRFAGPVNEYTRVCAERDEWKRKAGVMTERVMTLESRINDAYLPQLSRARASLLAEQGHGIDSRPDNSISHLPEDLLADDAE